MPAARVGRWAATKGLACAAHLMPQLRPLLAPASRARRVPSALESMRKPRQHRSYDASPRRRRAEESREHVLEVARRLVAERVYARSIPPRAAAARPASARLPQAAEPSGTTPELLSDPISMLSLIP